jgi:glyoxylase I family protein
MLSKAALQPRGLNHHAYATLDMDETHRFWTEIMGCNFLGAFSFMDSDTHDKPIPDKYIHSLYGMSDGSALAFFELQNGFVKNDDGIPKYTKHLALSCDSKEQVAEWHRHFEKKGLKVLGEIDHEGVWLSIYVTDPSGLTVEITYQSHTFDEADVEEGLKCLKLWREDKNAYLATKGQ